MGGVGIRSFTQFFEQFVQLRIVLHIGGHVRPVISFADMSVHAGLSGMTSQYRVVSEVEHTRSEHVG